MYNEGFKERLERMIELCKSIGGEKDFIAIKNWIITEIFNFVSLGIITHDEGVDYIKRLEEAK